MKYKQQAKFWVAFFLVFTPTSLVLAANDLSMQLSSQAPVAQYAKEMKKAEDSFSREDVVSAIAILERMAKKGYIPAQVRLGEILDYAEQDAEAIKWLGEAAQRGDAAALYKLGMMYSSGEGVQVNNPHAIKLVRMSADRNYLLATRTLFHAYRDGSMGLQVDLEQARYWQSRMSALEAAEKKIRK